MDAALALLACFIQNVWPILQSSLRYVTDPKYFHQTLWSGITSLPISISCIFLRKLKITAHEHWWFDCSISKLYSLEQNNNKDAEDDVWPVLDIIANRKKKKEKNCYLFPTQKLGLEEIGVLKPLIKYRSSSRPLSGELLRCYTDWHFPEPAQVSEAKKQLSVSSQRVIFNFLYSLSSKLVFVLRNMYVRKKDLNKGLGPVSVTTGLDQPLNHWQSHILISLDFTAKFQMLVELPKEKSVL